ncbi:hypothetical protein [Microbacterium elymi]|uniref:Uncharacterized protein n=1 Tax=Microbacterium elymi TaxID=2909587 RepID=A0ABY5NK28_9MICO|nr:hypothetical protein [Microbacterium elymi]UUT35523.1 hypothetical protein L2X98_19415 [Microbacterium elymi]
MTKQTAADREAPLTDDSLLTERVSHLLGQAHRRQIWMMFLDEDDVQAPLIIPCADLPSDPGRRSPPPDPGTSPPRMRWRGACLR